MENKFQDCYFQMENGLLTIGNSQMQRQWAVADRIVCLSIFDKTICKEWIAGKPFIYWEPLAHERTFCYKQDIFQGNISSFSVASEVISGRSTDSSCLCVKVFLTANAGINLLWEHRIYPGRAIYQSNITCVRQGEVMDYPLSAQDDPADDYIDAFALNGLHCKWKSVCLLDQTDSHNNLVNTQQGFLYGNELHQLQGNILELEDIFTAGKMILIKNGPTPLGYIGDQKKDFTIWGNNLYVNGFGFGAHELDREKTLTSYGVTLLLCRKSEMSTCYAMDRYHKTVNPIDGPAYCFVMSNTWGDRSKDGRVCESFLLKELELAAEMGINFYQIDDGWQQGATKNSISGGGIWGAYYQVDNEFWEINRQRFPNGFRTITEKARQVGIKLALWFSPDGSNEYANYKKDAAKILELYQKHGIDCFKIDGIDFKSKIGEQRLRKLFQIVDEKSDHRIMINLDATAEKRWGYFAEIPNATLFLENRYTDWHRYYPTWTLRNLWMLTPYISPYQLQMEFLNVNRNQHLFTDDPLGPQRTGAAFALAVTLCSNPLAWLEVSGLSEEDRHLYKAILQCYKKHQHRILKGTVIPLGEQPCGTEFTGFQSVLGKNKGYVFLYKEAADRDYWEFSLDQAEHIRVQKLLGDGEIYLEGQKLVYHVKGHFKYILLYYQSVAEEME